MKRSIELGVGYVPYGDIAASKCRNSVQVGEDTSGKGILGCTEPLVTRKSWTLVSAGTNGSAKEAALANCNGCIYFTPKK